ncbi:hypothetical protein [Nocardioides dilutus]
MTSPSADRVSLGGSSRPRRPMHPARRRLILGMVLIMVGSFLPWLYVGGIAKSGAFGPGLWTFYASMLGLAAVLLPFHRIGAAHAAVMAAVALGIPAWQVVHAIGLVGFTGWMPGPGLVMVVAGGVVSAACSVRLLRDPAPTG